MSPWKVGWIENGVASSQEFPSETGAWMVYDSSVREAEQGVRDITYVEWYDESGHMIDSWGSVADSTPPEAGEWQSVSSWNTISDLWWGEGNYKLEADNSELEIRKKRLAQDRGVVHIEIPAGTKQFIQFDFGHVKLLEKIVYKKTITMGPGEKRTFRGEDGRGHDLVLYNLKTSAQAPPGFDWTNPEVLFEKFEKAGVYIAVVAAVIVIMYIAWRRRWFSS